MIHFVASDAHNLSGRPHKLRAAYDLVQAEFGEEKAEALFRENPLAAFEGRALPHVPEISVSPPKKRWFPFF
jgi:protein-tyrosine phosphatase